MGLCLQHLFHIMCLLSIKSRYSLFNRVNDETAMHIELSHSTCWIGGEGIWLNKIHTYSGHSSIELFYAAKAPFQICSNVAPLSWHVLPSPPSNVPFPSLVRQARETSGIGIYPPACPPALASLALTHRPTRLGTIDCTGPGRLLFLVWMLFR